MSTIPKNHHALRTVLTIDAVATGGLALLCAVAAGALGDFLSISPSLLRWVGVLLLPFAGALAWSARRAPMPTGLVRFLIVGNVLWVIVSTLVAATGMLGANAFGIAFVVAQAAAVAVFAYFEHTNFGVSATTVAPDRAGAR
jgi:hypothetical protein